MRIHVEQREPGRHETDMNRAAVILPAYNEQARISDAVQRAPTAGAGHVICVDDGSTDETPRTIDELAEEERAEALHHSENRGKQAAVRTGLKALADRGGIEKSPCSTRICRTTRRISRCWPPWPPPPTAAPAPKATQASARTATSSAQRCPPRPSSHDSRSVHPPATAP